MNCEKKWTSLLNVALILLPIPIFIKLCRMSSRKNVSSTTLKRNGWPAFLQRFIPTRMNCLTGSNRPSISKNRNKKKKSSNCALNLMKGRWSHNIYCKWLKCRRLILLSMGAILNNIRRTGKIITCKKRKFWKIRNACYLN